MKKSDVKISQEYEIKPFQSTCYTCKNFRMDRTEFRNGYFEEKNLSCSIGEFAVQKTAKCKLWELKK